RQTHVAVTDDCCNCRAIVRYDHGRGFSSPSADGRAAAPAAGAARPGRGARAGQGGPARGHRPCGLHGRRRALPRHVLHARLDAGADDEPHLPRAAGAGGPGWGRTRHHAPDRGGVRRGVAVPRDGGARPPRRRAALGAPAAPAQGLRGGHSVILSRIYRRPPMRLPWTPLVALAALLGGGTPARADEVTAFPADLAKLKRLALADPEAVPAGIYARRYLETVGLWPALHDRVVPTLDVRAALAAVESENVPAGIVYRTDAALSKRVRVAFEVPR